MLQRSQNLESQNPVTLNDDDDDDDLECHTTDISESRKSRTPEILKSWYLDSKIINQNKLISESRDLGISKFRDHGIQGFRNFTLQQSQISGF